MVDLDRSSNKPPPVSLAAAAAPFAAEVLDLVNDFNAKIAGRPRRLDSAAERKVLARLQAVGLDLRRVLRVYTLAVVKAAGEEAGRKAGRA